MLAQRAVPPLPPLLLLLLGLLMLPPLQVVREEQLTVYDAIHSLQLCWHAGRAVPTRWACCAAAAPARGAQCAADRLC